jgi:hypothetical protein
LADDVKHRIVGTPIVDTRDLQRIDDSEEDYSNEWKVPTGVVTYEGRIYVPQYNLLPKNHISCFHDNTESGHVGVLKTSEYLSQDLRWPALDNAYENTSPDVNYATKSHHHATPSMAQTCH